MPRPVSYVTKKEFETYKKSFTSEIKKILKEVKEAVKSLSGDKKYKK